MASSPEDFGRKVHGEDLNEDLAFTWSRILQGNGEAQSVEQLANHDAWDRITVFVSILFLAKMDKVALEQQQFPYGEILVKRLSDEETIEAVPTPHAPQAVVA